MHPFQILSWLAVSLATAGCIGSGDSIDDDGRDLEGSYTLFLTLEDAWDFGPELAVPDVYRFSIERTADGYAFRDSSGPLSVFADDVSAEGLHVFFDTNLEFVKSQDDDCGPVGQIQDGYSSFHLIFVGESLYGDIDSTVSFEPAWPPQDPDPCIVTVWHLFRALGQRE